MRPFSLPRSAFEVGGSCIVTSRHIMRTCRPPVNQDVFWVIDQPAHEHDRSVLNHSGPLTLWEGTRPMGARFVYFVDYRQRPIGAVSTLSEELDERLPRLAITIRYHNRYGWQSGVSSLIAKSAGQFHARHLSAVSGDLGVPSVQQRRHKISAAPEPK